MSVLLREGPLMIFSRPPGPPRFSRCCRGAEAPATSVAPAGAHSGSCRPTPNPRHLFLQNVKRPLLNFPNRPRPGVPPHRIFNHPMQSRQAPHTGSVAPASPVKKRPARHPPKSSSRRSHQRQGSGIHFCRETLTECSQFCHIELSECSRTLSKLSPGIMPQRGTVARAPRIIRAASPASHARVSGIGRGSRGSPCRYEPCRACALRRLSPPIPRDPVARASATMPNGSERPAVVLRVRDFH